jgi:P pilus assembly chaperone PapD
MIMVQSKNMMAWSCSVISTLLLSVFLLCSNAKASIDGVAIEPMDIKIKKQQPTKFYIYNETSEDYIITSKVISNWSGDDKIHPQFVVNPPVRLLKKKSDVTSSIIYFPKNGNDNRDGKYYLSVTFIPKKKEIRDESAIPIIIVQQIPITLDY